MEFFVNLIRVTDDRHPDAKSMVGSCCIFVKNDIYIFEGDLECLTDAMVGFEKLDDGAVGSLGDLSQDELVELCKDTFSFDYDLLNDSEGHLPSTGEKP